MSKYHGGNRVKKGTYWNLANGDRVDIADEDVLPGDSKAKYTRFSPGLMLLFGPVAGLVYVIALPFIAIATLIMLIGKKIFGGLLNLVGNIVSFGWRPSEAHLAGKKGKKKENKNPDSGQSGKQGG